MNTPLPQPRVGIGTLIISNNQVLLGQRLNTHGNLQWAPPGGHLEFGESFEGGARREILEETGLTVGSIIQGPTINTIFANEHKHYVSIFMIAAYTGGSPELREPHKCRGWQWFTVTTLPTPLFVPLQQLVDQGFDFGAYSTYLHNNASNQIAYPCP